MFAVKATKVFKQMNEPMTIVVTGRKGLIMELTGNQNRKSTHNANPNPLCIYKGLIIIRLFYYLDLYSIIISELLLWFSLILNFCGLETPMAFLAFAKHFTSIHKTSLFSWLIFSFSVFLVQFLNFDKFSYS